MGKASLIFLFVILLKKKSSEIIDASVNSAAQTWNTCISFSFDTNMQKKKKSVKANQKKDD